MKTENVAQLIERIASQLNATTYIEPIYKKFGIIFFSNGRRLFFKDRQININTASSVSVTTNKFETSNFLSHFGYNVPTGRTFSNHPYDIKHNRSVEDGIVFAKELGFPVILKPNNKSQGVLVCKVGNEEEFRDIAAKILRNRNDALLVEKFYGGYSDYRIVVLGERVISAYQRIPLTVTGNGRQNILELLKDKQAYYKIIGRESKEIDIDDFRIKMHLQGNNMDLNYIPFTNEQVTLLDNANLSSGGTTLELTEKIAKEYCQLAVSVAHDMNLKLCGIDILTHDIKVWSEDHIILEVNSAPGLDNYAYTGEKQKEYVDELYLQTLKYFETSF